MKKEMAGTFLPESLRDVGDTLEASEDSFTALHEIESKKIEENGETFLRREL